MIHRTPISFIVALVLLLAAGTCYGMWYRTVIHESTRLAELTREADDKDSTTEHTISSKGALRALFADKEALAGYFLSSADVVQFLEQLEKTGHSLGSEVSVASVSSDAAVVPQRLTISLKITGSFEAVARTVGAIEYGPYDMSILNLTLQEEQDQKKNVLWVATGLFSAGIHPLTQTP